MTLPAPSPQPAGAHVVVKGLTKTFVHGDRILPVLRGLDFDLRPGDIASIVGASGAGKSTLLHTLGTIDAPTSGTILFDGVDVTKMTPAQLADFRNRQIGFVFQFHHLLARVHGARERHDAGPHHAAAARAVRRARRGPGCCGSASASGCSIVPVSCRGASSSAWRWRGRCC